MMKTLSVLSIASIAISLTLIGATDSFAKPESKNFVAPLSGSQEVPPVDTKATGLAKFQVNKDGDEISYKLIVANIENVRFAHIHMAPEGQNGPVVVTLFPGPTTDGRTNGIIAEGSITASDVVGPLAGDFDALIDRMTIGNAYVNVHTDANPPGEIRGQISEAGPSR